MNQAKWVQVVALNRGRKLSATILEFAVICNVPYYKEKIDLQIWHKLQEWWESLRRGEKIALLTLLVGSIGVLGTWLGNQGDTLNQNTNGGTANVHTGTGDIHANVTSNTHIQNQTIHIGITLEQHEQRLKRRETEIRADLEQAHAADRQLLEIELRDIEQRLQDTQASYEAHIADLKERIAQLEQLRGEFPDRLLDQAIDALQQGETDKADRLFKQIEDESDGHIKRVAEAAFQRGKIAKDAIRYTDALEHYEKAVRLQPYNTLYLNEAGLLHHTLANYKEAITHFELALTGDIMTHGESHPRIAIRRNNLGLAWNSLGEHHKAIEYYELALASSLKTYGENHPSVAAIRNNLGGAQDSLGEYHKAIEYYELALANVLKTYGENHPSVATTRNNLGSAWRQLGEYHKAIEYHELALASVLKTHGENHPDVARDRNNLGLAWHSLGEYHKAIAYFELALATLEKFLGKDHPNTRAAQANLDAARTALIESQQD